MSLKGAKIVPDVRVYAHKKVSKEHGRKTLDDLKAKGLVKPEETATGRRYLDFADAERLADAL